MNEIEKIMYDALVNIAKSTYRASDEITRIYEIQYIAQEALTEVDKKLNRMAQDYEKVV